MSTIIRIGIVTAPTIKSATANPTMMQSETEFLNEGIRMTVNKIKMLDITVTGHNIERKAIIYSP